VFEGLIKAYCNNQVYPPSSPTSILQTYKEVKQSQLMSAEQAWEIVESNLHKSIRGYQTMVNGNIVSRNDFYQAIKEHTQIVAVCKEIESSLADITTESKKYVRNEFMTIYKRYSEQAVSIGYDERLKLT
jgi:uridine phosphorylase